MFEPSPDEPSIATAGAARIAELARGGIDPVAERRRAANRECKRRASAKAPPAENQPGIGEPQKCMVKRNRTRLLWCNRQAGHSPYGSGLNETRRTG
jgi:hypothetical protein